MNPVLTQIICTNIKTNETLILTMPVLNTCISSSIWKKDDNKQIFDELYTLN